MSNLKLEYFGALHKVFENIVADVETKLEQSDDGDRHGIKESRAEALEFLDFQIKELQTVYSDLSTMQSKNFLNIHST